MKILYTVGSIHLREILMYIYKGKYVSDHIIRYGGVLPW